MEIKKEHQLEKRRIEFSFDYYKIPEKYRVGERPQDLIISYREDLKGLEKGIFSNLQKAGDIAGIQEIIKKIESGDESEIRKIIDKYTSGSRTSPFVPTSRNPEIAQVFATKPSTTIYQLRIPANRIILDAEDIGGTGKAELFVIGTIYPEEIIAVKRNNDDVLHSELYDPVVRGVRLLPAKDSKSREPKDPENWVKINNS